MAYENKKVFNIRILVCFFLIMSGFLSCILRIAVITSGNYSEVQSKQSSYRVDIGSLRGTIFDCNKIPITNSQSVIMAAIIPSEISRTWVLDYVPKEDREAVINKLGGTAPFVTRVKEKIELDGVATTTYYYHNSKDMVSTHLIGYVGSDGHGVSGLEKAYDSLLYSESRVSAVFKTDGIGEVLKGEKIEIENDTSVLVDGVVSTIDINIQTAVEQATKNMKKGAAVVAEVESGKIRAMVSRPDFDVTNVSKYLKSDDSPLLNRCISAYNVGSAFKPCVAATAIENNSGGFVAQCKGFETITDRKFACHEKNGHGIVDMGIALSHSCNVFFYNLALNLGGNVIYNMAANLNFGNKIKLCENFYTAEGNLTDRGLLYNNAELANLSIGQGRLLLTPVSILTLYCAIANGGSYRLPTVLEGTVKNGIFKEAELIAPTRVMRADTAEILKQHLVGVILDGTGKAAKPKSVSAAGKTATAQTGRYKNGIEITHSWFCGFFPAENPKYAVSVMVEDGTGSAEIFAAIADAIAEQIEI